MTTARASSLAAGLTILIGLLALLGGWLGVPVLTTFLPGQPAMPPGTAIMTILIGLGLWLTPAAVSPRPTLPALACGVVVVLVSLYFLRVSDDPSPLPIDNLTLLVLGIALLCLQIPPTPVLTLSTLSVFAVVMPLYHLAERSLLLIGHDDLPACAMSPNTALALCLLAGPALFLHPRLPFGQQLFAATPQGRLMLTLMPWGTLAPVLLAVTIHYVTDQNNQYFELTIVTTLALFSALVTAVLWRGHEKLRSADFALREREDLTRSVMNSLASSIAVLDTQGKIVRVNDAWQKFAGTNGGNELLQGGSGLDYLETCRRAAAGDPLAARALAGLDALLRGELPYFALEYPCHAPHEQRWFMMQARPLIGAMPGLVVSHLDITQRKLAELDLAAHKDHLEQMVARRTRELENARAQAELILDSTADGIFGLDLQGRVIFINPAACAMLGYTEAALIGRRAHSTFHHSHADGSAFPAEACRMLDAVRDGRTVHIDNEVFWRADGTALPVAYATQPMQIEGRIVGAVMSFHDMSIQRATEQAHAALLTEARRLAQAKSDFLANMSHEIRTPLNAVLGLARIGARENIGRKTGQTCQQIIDAGQHLLGVINDILDFSKIDAGKLSVETHPFRLAAVTDAALGFVAESAASRQIDLSFKLAETLPAWVTGDRLRLQQILINLLSNAVKFTRQGRVTLAVSHDAAGAPIRFAVVDTGIGMTVEQVSRLFNAFEQADGSTTRAYGGTGLGLAISQRLAHLMGGAIEVSSHPGTGSTFTLTLPLPTSAPGFEPTALSTPPTRRLAGLRLLAADDIEVNRLILEDLLSHEGAHTVFAKDGQQVLTQLDEHGSSAFDAILMDVQMPVMDGYAATQAIRIMAPTLPVIGLTAHALANEREKCLAAGMVEHVTKPIDPDSLVAAILRHVQPPVVPVSANLPAVPPAPTFAAPQIDWPALRARFNHKDEFLRKLAASVQDGHAASSAKLVNAAAQQDYAALAFVAHSLKGTGGNLFARQLFELAEVTETAAREKRLAAIALAGRLARLCEVFLAALASGIETHEG